jgi:hypothetical protein
VACAGDDRAGAVEETVVAGDSPPQVIDPITSTKTIRSRSKFRKLLPPWARLSPLRASDAIPLHSSAGNSINSTTCKSRS